MQECCLPVIHLLDHIRLHVTYNIKAKCRSVLTNSIHVELESVHSPIPDIATLFSLRITEPGLPRKLLILEGVAL